MTKVLKTKLVLKNDLKKLCLRSSSKNSKVRVSAKQIEDKFEQKIFFEITVFENDVKKQKFDKVINEFSDI